MLLEYLDSTAFHVPQTSWLVPGQLMDQLFHALAGREQKTHWSVNFEVLILFAAKKFQLQTIKLSPFIVATIACQLLWLKIRQSTAKQDHARISNHVVPYLAMANRYCFLASRHNLTKSQFPPGPAASWQMIARAKADSTCDSTKACPRESQGPMLHPTPPPSIETDFPAVEYVSPCTEM